LSKLDWNFVNYTWSDAGFRGLTFHKQKLLEALKLQNDMLNNGIATTELRLAAARTNFWLGVSSDSNGKNKVGSDGGDKNKKEYLAEAVALFDELKSDKDEIRLQWADAVRLNASVMPLDEPTVTATQALAVVAERERAYALYKALLKPSSSKDPYTEAA